MRLLPGKPCRLQRLLVSPQAPCVHAPQHRLIAYKQHVSMPQLEQVFRHLAHAALIVQAHIVVAFALIKIAIDKHNGLARHLHQLTALVGLQTHHNQPHGVPGLGDTMDFGRRLRGVQHGVIAVGADGVFQRGDHLADEGILQGEFFLSVGIIGNHSHDFAVALGQHARPHIGNVMIFLQLFADHLRRLGRHFFQVPMNHVGYRRGGYAHGIGDFLDGHSQGLLCYARNKLKTRGFQPMPKPPLVQCCFSALSRMRLRRFITSFSPRPK